MKPLLVDSNVILDVVTDDPRWCDWSSGTLEKLADSSILVINPIIYAEVSVGFELIEDLEDVLPRSYFRRETLPWESAFLAGKCFARYKRRRGAKTTTLPDFFVGAHAAIRGYGLLTRDAARYRTYFPSVTVIAP
jgi:predicted nucleic acid-binding protein